jgi:hypothetical protein
VERKKKKRRCFFVSGSEEERRKMRDAREEEVRERTLFLSLLRVRSFVRSFDSVEREREREREREFRDASHRVPAQNG